MESKNRDLAADSEKHQQSEKRLDRVNTAEILKSQNESHIPSKKSNVGPATRINEPVVSSIKVDGANYDRPDSK